MALKSQRFDMIQAIKENSLNKDEFSYCFQRWKKKWKKFIIAGGTPGSKLGMGSVEDESLEVWWIVRFTVWLLGMLRCGGLSSGPRMENVERLRC
ncbi:hypothetical protein LAZ67_21000277 [Cordylochernes scorpioides]|uniref:Uncharacterized protein n=1 Tax=Cordylochernes scorpioides TaxID=51811 RepID=A0ABY6LLA3_9ARAC|nr:hypothetical protein LAZ67_21000277 [Cordylochernes scorpioides]